MADSPVPESPVPDSPVRWGILGTGGIEVYGGFYPPATVTSILRQGDLVRVRSVHEGRVRHQASEVARRLSAADVVSRLMPQGKAISAVETAGTVLAQVRRNA